MTTDRDIFNKISRSLLDQHDKCLDSSGDPSYFGIKSKDYDKFSDLLSTFDDWEDISIDELFRSFMNEGHADEARCAIGFIIDSEEYYNTIDNGEYFGYDIEEESVLDSIKRSNPEWQITNRSIDMMKTLQTVHDSLNVSDWSEALTRLSNYFSDNYWSGESRWFRQKEVSSW